MSDTPAATDTDALHRLARLLNHAAHDPELHGRLLADPRAALAEAGLPVDDSVEVTAEITPPARAAAVAGRTTPDRLVLPVPPLVDGRELSDADLDGVSGGGALANFFGSLFGAARAAFNQIFLPEGRHSRGGRPAQCRCAGRPGRGLTRARSAGRFAPD
ncbi:hypothetical protein [Tistrella mobilis]|uniref:Uncharacterized protein n=1 Tax=Tistrella mobilis (strain KA081020-065) TaxID=1110502 RepID=I3TSW5_TISMK|nr:hypothetical protein [Tistrella mobilis]AFK55853.1 hypothetical protein TMO_a0450 [Tistrella mobilis KA081020-065]